MSFGLLSSLRVRLITLVALAIAPALGLFFYKLPERLNEAREDIKMDSMRLTRGIASAPQSILPAPQQFLASLARIPEVEDPGSSGACERLFSNILVAHPAFLALGVAGRDGTVACASPPVDKPLNVSDRLYFRRALETRDFAIGNYQPASGSLAGRKTVGFAYPVIDGTGEVQSVLYLILDLGWLNQVLEKARFPQEAIVTALDSAGTILARYPDVEGFVGRTIPELPSYRSIVAGKEGTVTEEVWLDGTKRVSAYVALFFASEGSVFLRIGIPEKILYAKVERILARELMMLGLTTLLVLVAAWLASQWLVLGRVRELTRAATRLRDGDLSTRVTLKPSHDELGFLALTFNGMAKGLQTRTVEMERAIRALRTASGGNQALLHADDEQRLLEEICRIAVKRGGYRFAWVGYAEQDEQKSIRPAAHFGFEDGYLKLLRLSYGDSERGREMAGTAIRTGKPCVVANIQTDPKFALCREAAVQRGYASAIALPLRIDGTPMGALALYAEDADEFDQAEVELLTELADDLAFGIATLRLREEARRSEAALHAHQQRLTLHVGRTPLAVIEWTPDFKVMEWNPAAETIFGYSRAETLGRHGAFIFPSESGREPDTVRTALKAKTGHAYNTIENVAKGGKAVFCEWHNAELVDTEGNHIGAASVVQDVTDRVHAERNRARTEKRFAELYEFAPDALITSNHEGVITMINRQTEAVFGWSRAELVGRPFEMLIPEKLRRAYAEIRANVVQAPRLVTTGEGRFNLQGVRKDGTVFPAEISLSPMGSDASSVIIAAVRDVTEREKAEDTIRHLAYFDPLTGLANRVQLTEHLEREIGETQREHRPLALLTINVVRFRDLQDGLGFRRAQQLLQQIAQRIQKLVKKDELLARLGGDKFALLLPRSDARDAMDVADEVSRTMREPFAVEGLMLDVRVSIGLAIYPGHGTEADSLMLRSDIAARQARQAGERQVVYTGVTDQESPERLVMIAELRNAIESDQLLLHYQPKIDMRSGRVCGAEALVRWQHPEHGMMPPGKFISLAEYTGLIKPLTYWVIDAALRQCSLLEKAGVVLPVAVNLSAHNLHDPELLDRITGLFSTWSVQAARLEIEITESMLMADPARSLEVLKRLKEMGVKVAIDDFGTGYSSLSYLATLPVQGLKIDRSFIVNMSEDRGHMTIVEATISLAHSLNLKVVAEGVETEEQAQVLRRLKCDEFQGYLYSPPLPANEFQEWQAKFKMSVGQPGS